MVGRNWNFEGAEAQEALLQRKSYLQFLRATCTPDSDYDAALMVFLELVANVVRHAAGPIQISVRPDGLGGATLEVVDNGAPFIFDPNLPSSDSESGRGLYLISQFCIDVIVARGNNGNVVRVRLPVEWNKDQLNRRQS